MSDVHNAGTCDCDSGLDDCPVCGTLSGEERCRCGEPMPCQVCTVPRTKATYESLELETEALRKQNRRLDELLTQSDCLLCHAEDRLERVREAFGSAAKAGRNITDKVLRTHLNDQRKATLCCVPASNWYAIRAALDHEGDE